MNQTLNDRLAAHFRAHPGEWIDGKELATIAGGYGWRSRCSDLRKRGMTVENKQERRHGYTRSFYRYVPDLPTRVEPSGQVAFL
jgi:hypothetical protein